MTIEDVINAMPHGDGWDNMTKLRQQFKNGDYKLESGYHCMDVNGYYDDWITVYTILDLVNKKIVRVTYEAHPTTRRKYISGQNSYYEECISEALEKLGFE